MKLNKLTLHNIRTYTNTEIVFSEGISLLSGDIGAGKTTILMAIEFALFGASRTDLPSDSLLHNKSVNGSVTLDFDCDKNYVIHRPLQRTKTTVKQLPGTLNVDGVEHSLTATELRAKMLEVLGYPESMLTKTKNDLYRYTVYCPQDHMRTILEAAAEERIEILRKLFELDKYKRVKTNVDTYCKDLRPQLKVIKETFTELNTITAQCEEYTQKIVDAQTLLQAAQQQLDVLQKDYEQLNKAAQQKVELEKKKSELTTTYTVNKTKIDTLQKSMVELQKVSVQPTPDIESKETELRILDKKLGQARELDTQYAHTYQQWKLAREHAQKVLSQPFTDTTDTIKRKLKDAQNVQLNTLETQYAKTSSQIEVMTKDIAECTNHIVQLQQRAQHLTEKQCTQCGQHISSEYANTQKQQCTQDVQQREQIVNTLQHTLDKLKEQQRTLHDDIVKSKHLSLELPRLQEDLERVTQTKGERDKAKNVLNKEQPNYVSNTKKLTDKYLSVQQELVNMKQLIVQVTQAKEKVQAYTHDIDRIKQQNEVVQKEIQQIVIPTVDVAQLEKAQQAYIAQKEQVVELQSRITHLSETKRVLTTQLEKMVAQRDKHDNLKQRHDWLEQTFQPILSMIEKEQFAKVYHVCNESFQHWFQYLLQNKQLYGCLDETFTPYIEQDSVVPFNYLSGGERTATSLAYRLALTTVVNQLLDSIQTKDLLILDEPTDGFSAEQIQSLTELLKELPVNQILIVSHDIALESMVNRVYKIEKVNGVSHVTE